jgi:NTP pyrophosphatase (non-canonical NTP hydrolase)
MTEDQLIILQLGEECNEVAQRVSKYIRFGSDDVQAGHTEDNRERLQYEFTDLLAVFEMACERGLLDRFTPTMRPAVDAKKEKVRKYLEYSREHGIVTD